MKHQDDPDCRTGERLVRWCEKAAKEAAGGLVGAVKTVKERPFWCDHKRRGRVDFAPGDLQVRHAIAYVETFEPVVLLADLPDEARGIAVTYLASNDLLNLIKELRSFPDLVEYLDARLKLPPDMRRTVGREKDLYAYYLLNGETFDGCRSFADVDGALGDRSQELERRIAVKQRQDFFATVIEYMSDSLEDVERFIGHLKKLPGLKGDHLSAVRVNKARNLLRKILDRAVKNGWLRDNPVLEVRRLREDPAVIDPLSWKEVALLVDKGFKHDPERRRFYTVAIFTGLRTSELIGLKWTDLDWTTETPTAMVKRSFTKLDGEHLTKTAGSTRAIDLRPQATRALKEQQAASRLKSEYVFPNAIGGPLDRDNLMNRVWNPALKRAGIRERKPYQTRHTFATLALSAGEEIGWVAKQLGHANTEMVIRHYYRWVRNNTRQDGAALDRAAAQFGL